MRYRPGRFLAAAALAALLAGCIAQAAPEHPGEDGPLPIDSRAVPFHTTDPAQETAGWLRFRGGVALTSPDGRFGGLSGLHVSPDGKELTAVTDKGHWVRAMLRYDEDGRLAGVGGGRIGLLRDREGRPITGTKLHDAEALARVKTGFVVAFEGRHRIWFYPDRPAPFDASPVQLPMPRWLDDARRNQGIESLAALADGRLVAITQGLTAGDAALRGWLYDGRRWRPFAWPRSGRYEPSGATALPDGDLLVLERRFTFAGGFAVRLVRVPAASLRPGITAAGEEMGMIEPPYTVDNFEAIAARRGPRGETLIYLLADDNFHPLQRSLLFMVELLPAP